MMKKYDRMIHIASFDGNLGDLVNHRGFYDSMGIDEKKIEKVEIRHFYNKCFLEPKMSFDPEFAAHVNESDLLILGGGSFFDVSYDRSGTGTTLDFKEGFADRLKIPVLVNAMGFHPDRSHMTAINTFKTFFDDILSRPDWFIALRNDGSGNRLKEVYGDHFDGRVMIVPDNGFMCPVIRDKIKVDTDRRIVGISLSRDINEGYSGGLTRDEYREKIIGYIDRLSERYFLIFFPHTPGDLEMIDAVLEKLGRERFRRNIVIAPYIPNMNGVYEMMRYYRACDVIVGMRFHACVMAFINHIPVAALSLHDQISDFFDELGLSDLCVKVSSDRFTERLDEIVEGHVNGDKYDYDLRIDGILESVREGNQNYRKDVEVFLERFGNLSVEK